MDCDKLHNTAPTAATSRGTRSKSKTRRTKMKRTAPATSAFANFGRALQEVVENRRALFSCPMCRRILSAPVTGECGHTFCAACVEAAAARCVTCDHEGAASAPPPPAAAAARRVNVLVQDICNKWRDTHPRQLECGNSSEILGFEPRYMLRSRPVGLLVRNNCQDTIVTRTVRLLLMKSISDRRRDKRISERELNRILHCVNLTKERHLKESWKHLEIADLECVLCSRIFHEPVTTNCGHTFCRSCLARVIDHGLGCPLCMAPLNPFEESNGITACIEDAVRLLFPKAYSERVRSMHKELKTSNSLPVFVCTNAFPGVACPLYVYEPRYRLLARRCLQTKQRRFAMVARMDNTPDRFAPYGTILEVKDAVHLHNGTSILSTIGVRRFKVTSKGEQDGYDTAKVQYIEDVKVSSEKLPEILELHAKVYQKAARWVKSLVPMVLAEVENCIGEMPPLESHWFNIPDGPAWTWWLMPILPLSSNLQIGFLRTTSLEKRLRAIDKLLEHMETKFEKKALKPNSMKCTDTVETSDSCRMWLV